MPSLDAALNTYETLAALHALPDQAALTTAEAALFLRLSPKTLERMRLDGSGPRYIQGGKRGATGGNQKCLYLKEELLSWQKKNQISNAMEAAIRKGKTFSTILDLLAEEPYYVDTGGTVAGLAENTPLGVAILRIGSTEWKVVWLTAIDAATLKWASVGEHKELSRNVSIILETYRGKVAAAFSATELCVAIQNG